MSTETVDDGQRRLINAFAAFRKANGRDKAISVLKRVAGVDDIADVPQNKVRAVLQAFDVDPDGPIPKNSQGFPVSRKEAPQTTGAKPTMESLARDAYGAPPKPLPKYSGFDDPALQKAAWTRFNNPPKGATLRDVVDDE